ncbi:hypothetical protein ACN38_g2287, partial [Penicillium nordicum]
SHACMHVVCCRLSLLIFVCYLLFATIEQCSDGLQGI